MRTQLARRLAGFLAAFLVVCGTTVLFPGIDLRVSSLFYRPGDGFFLGRWRIFQIIHADLRFLVIAIILAAIALLAVALWRRPAPGIGWRGAAFLLIALAVGPGLIVNSLFKDHWGRARPEQVTVFGGAKRFTPAFVPSDQCARNCSFPAGDPAVGFYFVAFGFLATSPRARRRGIAAGLVLGAALGAMRIAQGGHFLSDVLAAGFLVFAATWLLHRWIVLGDGLSRLGAILRQPPPPLRRLAGLGLVTAATIAAAYRYADLPLAIVCHDLNPTVLRIFHIITALGVATGWLVIAAALVLILGFAARRSLETQRQRRLSRRAWRAVFVFVAVAGAGLTADILKPVFGRARPKLWFNDHVFGFTWHGGHAAYWSFPSGHTVTIVALATALSLIHRRGLPVYALAAFLVAASRIILTEHYLGDVLGGAYLALVAVLVIWTGFRRAGIELSDSP